MMDEEGNEAGKLFVGGLSQLTHDESLRKYFGNFGDVDEAVVMMDPRTGRSRGFGYVKYANSDSVFAVLNSAPHVLDEKQIDPKQCNVNMKGRNRRSLKVFVGGVAPEHDADTLRKYFETYGTVTDVNLMMEQNRQRHRGFAFVGFESEQTIRQLIDIRYLKIEGKQVEIKAMEPPNYARKGTQPNGNGLDGPNGMNQFGPNWKQPMDQPCVYWMQQPGQWNPMWAPVAPTGWPNGGWVQPMEMPGYGQWSGQQPVNWYGPQWPQQQYPQMQTPSPMQPMPMQYPQVQPAIMQPPTQVPTASSYTPPPAGNWSGPSASYKSLSPPGSATKGNTTSTWTVPPVEPNKSFSSLEGQELCTEQPAPIEIMSEQVPPGSDGVFWYYGGAKRDGVDEAAEKNQAGGDYSQMTQSRSTALFEYPDGSR